jgi:ribosomal protein S18 acetylase RimI-like enzyme
VIRRIEPGDARLLRELRLGALRLDPLAFASTYDREISWGSEWDEWAEEDASGDDTATFLAFDGDDGIGLAAGFRDDERPERFHLVALWVAPEARGRGHGRALVEQVSAWAASAGGRELQLWVTGEPAAALYRSLGFVVDGRRQPLPHAAEVEEVGMTRPLAG